VIISYLLWFHLVPELTNSIWDELVDYCLLLQMSKGIPYILMASFAFAWMNILAKELSDFHPMQVVFFRALGTFVFIFPFMIYRKIPIWGNTPKFLFLRSILGMLSLGLFFFAVQRIPLGSAISIRYIGPIFGAVLALFWLKEKISLGQWISFAVAFAGVLVIKGFDLRIDPLSFAAIFTSAVFIGGVFVLIKYLSSREHILTIINHFMTVTIVASLLFISYWRIPTVNELPYICMIGICGLVGQVCMTRAFQLENASVLAPFKYMELVFALIIGFFIFEETYTLIPLLGMGLIIGGMILNILNKQKLPE